MQNAQQNQAIDIEIENSQYLVNTSRVVRDWSAEREKFSKEFIWRMLMKKWLVVKIGKNFQQCWKQKDLIKLELSDFNQMTVQIYLRFYWWKITKETIETLAI